MKDKREFPDYLACDKCGYVKYWNVDGKKFWGKKKWRKHKRYFYKNVSFFEGLKKRYWRGVYLYKLGLMLLGEL